MRTAVLWIFLAVADTVALTIYVYRAGTVRGILGSDIEGIDPGSTQAQLYMASGVLVPLGMAFATFVLSSRTNRWANGALALLLAVTLFFMVISDLGDPLTPVLAVMLLVSLSILWHAWRWPDEVPSVGRGQETAQRQVRPEAHRQAH
jgi:hypothetical protein